MTFVRAVVMLACFSAMGLLSALPGSAQAKKVLPRATKQQVEELLKKDPSLTSGFESPAQKAKIKVVKQVPGGVQVRYESERASGTLTVTGPATTVVARDWIGPIVDWILGHVGSNTGGGMKCTTTSTTTTTTENGKTTTSTTTTTTCEPA